MGTGSKAAAAVAASSQADSISPENLPPPHLHRRYFIGPQPEKASKGLLSSHAIRAFFSFNNENENEELDLNNSEISGFRKHVVDDVWKQSPWGQYLIERKNSKHAPSANASKWVGESFRIGTVGDAKENFDFIQETEQELRERMSVQSTRSSSSAKSLITKLASAPLLALPTIPESIERSQESLAVEQPATPTSSTPLISKFDTSSSSSTQCFRPLSSNGGTETLSYGKERDRLGLFAKEGETEAHFAEDNGVGPSSREEEEEEGEVLPVLPSIVLEREGTDVQGTSAGATVSTNLKPTTDSDFGGKRIVLDRMLVRVNYTKREDLPSVFDDAQMRTFQFMVVWRKNRIELYEDYSFRAQEWVHGHKHLSYVIPLRCGERGTPTTVSLFSFVDMTFCLTCRPTSTSEKQGTNIFVMKVKSRSPPVLETKTWRRTWSLLGSKLTREHVIKLCTEALMAHTEWKSLVGHQLTLGKELELAWRMDTTLDWLWLDNDIVGDIRPWVVVCGLAFKQSTMAAQLEIRLGDHFPTSFLLEDTNNNPRRSRRISGPPDPQRPESPEPLRRIQEPDSIEGYLDRIKPATHVKQQVYLAVHEGFLCSIHAAHAHPPQPPVPPPPGEDLATYTFKFRKAGGIKRSVAAVSSNPTHDEREPEHSHPSWQDHWLAEEPVEEDDMHCLEAHPDKNHARMRRSFELLLKSGHAYSCKTALEWITHLRSLIFYWKRRHVVDAREEMDLANTRRERVTPRVHVFRDEETMPPEPPPDLSAPMPALGTLYNWCVLEGCKPVLRVGKVYSRRGLRGQFKYVQLFLVRGELLRFRIAPKAPFHHATSKKISLLDAYVCSGYFAAIALPSGQYRPNAEPDARRYQDGLEADDPDEDLLFCLWYRSKGPPAKETVDASCSIELDDGKGGSSGGPIGSVPSLSAKRKLILFRTRSKLERDAWCWAINCEIERLVRVTKDRETKMRMTGTLAQIS
ncbi:Pleckstrin homology domain-containing protein [Flagelloscypha sp. PMI_526]|nr:Pleckstrin homology domain-containing protein [Flagelloscypha sp. PMI_526]